jgi:DNA-binding FrmR family transcriptional regulator
MSGNTFDAGSIESRLVLDRSDFIDGLREAKAEGENFARQSYTAKLKVDSSGALRDVAAVRAELASLRNVSLNIGVTGSNDQIRSISQSASALNGRNINMRVNIDGLDDSLARLRTLRQHVNALDGRTINVRADVDTAAALTQIAALRAALAGLNNTNSTVTASTNKVTSAWKKATPGMADLVALAMAAAPALIPIAGYLTNIAAGSIALGVSVGAGIGLFAAATMGAIKHVTALDKQSAAAKKTLDTQKATLDQLTPGTKAYGTQLEKVEQAQQKLNQITAQYSPTQKAFSNGLDGMKASWQNFVDSTSSVTLPIATSFIDTVSNSLPKLEPVVKAMAPEFKAIADDVARWASDGGLDRFLNTIIKTGVPAFRNIRLASKSFFAVLGSGYRAFLPEARHLSEVIKNGADSLARWSNAGGFQRFLGYVKQIAPSVRQFFTDFGDALGHIYDSLGPLAGLSLKFVDGILKLIIALPPSVIQAIYLGFIAWRAAVLGYAIAMGIATTATAIFETVASPFFLLLVGAAATVLAVVAAVVALGVGIYELVKHWGAVQGALVTAWNATWGAIKTAALAVWSSALKPAFDGIMTGVHAVGTAALWLWHNAIKPAFDAISFGARLLVVIVGTVLITPIYLLIKGLGALFGWLWKVAIKPSFDGIAGGAKWLYAVAIKPQIDAIVAVIHGAGAVAKWLWTHAFKPAIDGIAGGAKWLYTNGIKPSFNQIVGAVKEVGKWGKWLWNSAIHPTVTAIAGGAKWLYNSGIKPSFNGIVSALKTVGSWGKWLWDKALKPAWNTIQKGTNALKKGMIDTFSAMKSGIKKTWDLMRAVVAAPINFVIGTVYNGGIVKVWNKIADAVGLKSHELSPVGKIKYARGGAVTGGPVGVDGVNATLMRDEHVWTADEVANAGGHRAVAQMRSMFASAGKARVGPGMQSIDREFAAGSGYKMADGGGIFGPVGNAIGGAISTVKNVGSDLLGGLKDLARGAIGVIVNPILDKIKGVASSGIRKIIPGSPPWEDLVAGAATAPIGWIKSFVSKDDKKNANGGPATPGDAGALKWAKTQAGHPYSWGGVGPGGYDCSGFMSAIQNAIDGRPLHVRRWATGAFPPGTAGWQRNLRAPFQVGITNKGVGHTAGTLMGTNVESRGGAGVVIGPRARGAHNGYFDSVWGYKPSIGKHALGGVTTPGLSIMGEKGPELVASSGSDRVFTHAETRRLLKGAGSDSPAVIVNFPDTITIKTQNGSFEATVDDIARGTINDVVNDAAGSR